MLPAILTNAVIVVGCLLYLALLSWQVFLVAVLVVGLGSLGYHFAHLRAIRHLEVAAREQDGLFAGFRSVNAGAKELRLHQGKRAAFTQDVRHRSIEAVRRARTRGMSIFVVSTSWSHFLIYEMCIRDRCSAGPPSRRRRHAGRRGNGSHRDTAGIARRPVASATTAWDGCCLLYTS